MNKRSWAATALVFAALGLTLTWASAAEPPAKDKVPPAKQTNARDIFGLTKVWQFHLDVPAKDWETMQPVGGIRFPGVPMPPKPADKPGDKPTDIHKGGSFGIEYPFAHATFNAEGKAYKDVGLRYKGGGSFVMSAGKLKRNFKVELDHYNADLKFHEHKKINLNAGAMDPTRLRESLAFAVYREAGVAAPRTAFAEVTLTVPGKYDKELLGLYTVIEQVNKDFLKDHFKNGKGLLMKPEVGGARAGGPLAYLGDDWELYKAALKPKDEPTKKEAERVIAFLKLLNKADDEQFAKEVGNYLDMDAFLRFLAVTALVVNMDSFFTGGHNVYVYLNPETNKIVFIPWDLDLAFGAFFMFGSADQQADLSLMHPYAGTHKLVDRVLAIKDVNEKYQKVLKDVSAKCFTKEKLLNHIETLEKTTKDYLEREKKAADARKERAAPAFGQPGGQTGSDLRAFVEKRTASVEAQLAGKSKGYTPAGMGFGQGPGAFNPGKNLATQILKAAEADKEKKIAKDAFMDGAKKLYQNWDKDKKGKLDEKELAEAITRVMAPAPAQGAPARPAFGPGQFMSKPLLTKADADKDGKLTQEEFIAACETFFKDADKNKDSVLEEQELADGLTAMMPGARRPPADPPKPAEGEKKE